jgi:hypothetical protein
VAKYRRFPTLPGEVAGRTGDENAEINRRESQYARMPFVASSRLLPAEAFAVLPTYPLTDNPVPSVGHYTVTGGHFYVCLNAGIWALVL